MYIYIYTYIYEYIYIYIMLFICWSGLQTEQDTLYIHQKHIPAGHNVSKEILFQDLYQRYDPESKMRNARSSFYYYYLMCTFTICFIEN
jgi:hypothetical protein